MSIIDRMFVQIASVIENLKSEAGQGMVEYGLIVALVAVVAGVAFTVLGKDIATFITGVGASL